MDHEPHVQYYDGERQLMTDHKTEAIDFPEDVLFMILGSEKITLATLFQVFFVFLYPTPRILEIIKDNRHACLYASWVRIFMENDV